MMKGRTQQIMMIAAIAVVIYLLCVMNKNSNYSISEKEYSVFGSTATTGAMHMSKRTDTAEAGIIGFKAGL